MAALLTVALDLQAHARVERLGGVNVWGYRGPVMTVRRPNEIRLASVGGDTAFGWGVAASETYIAAVRQLVALALDRPGGAARYVTAVNLGATALHPSQYAGWIERYGYLHPDVVCIVVDPRRHHSGGAAMQPDRASTAFTWFGYAPVLALVLEEKGGLSRSAFLGAIGSTMAHVDHAMARAAGTTAAVADDEPSTERYVESIGTAMDVAVNHGAAVIVVAPPYPAGDAGADHAALAAMVEAKPRGTRVTFVDLGDVTALYEPDVWLGESVLSVGGHAVVGAALAPAVLHLIAAR